MRRSARLVTSEQRHFLPPFLSDRVVAARCDGSCVWHYCLVGPKLVSVSEAVTRRSPGCFDEGAGRRHPMVDHGESRRLNQAECGDYWLQRVALAPGRLRGVCIHLALLKSSVKPSHDERDADQVPLRLQPVLIDRDFSGAASCSKASDPGRNTSSVSVSARIAHSGQLIARLVNTCIRRRDGPVT